MEVKELEHALGAAETRPRERLVKNGVHSLSDRDLLAVVIGSGTRACGVTKLADRVLTLLEQRSFEVAPRDLMELSGMGLAKAAMITAALELGRRVVAPRDYRIRQPNEVVPLLQHYADRSQEHFLSVSLNGAHEVIAVRVVSIGLVNRTLVHPREVYADALKDRAAAVIVAHNHPSGSVHPSGEDRAVTRSLLQAGEVLGVRLLDHIIFSTRGHYSFLEHGLL